uniref:Ferritin-like domain-containing protein n=1 Tax=Roseihalotalea indica TaxID=2867963 RepID=A0AA49GI18_9BACT|nr:ferritin-like domain-containing protein [Tunicatimonas sp. TK19036]
MTQKEKQSTLLDPAGASSRRTFMKISGAAMAASGLILIGCDDEDEGMMMPDPDADAVDLGSGDVGILNYAYALEQLEAAFYTAVMDNNFFPGATDMEKQILSDLQKHEVAHRDFFKAAINSVADAIPALEVDFSSIDFDDRASVLGTAKVFEDLGVSAYNGAGQLITNVDYLVIAGKIVSVEARHAAAIRSILDSDATSFAGDDVVDSNGLDVARMPSEVLMAAAPFIVTPINASNLPTA